MIEMVLPSHMLGDVIVADPTVLGGVCLHLQDFGGPSRIVVVGLLWEVEREAPAHRIGRCLPHPIVGAGLIHSVVVADHLLEGGDRDHQITILLLGLHAVIGLLPLIHSLTRTEMQPAEFRRMGPITIQLEIFMIRKLPLY